ncbi:MAG: hypothetical protein EA393_06420 [Bacteroidetes bacterium]|nr:MAG: hypothetical protein EA393_06420 [Bacteroidota bacterium]
MKTLLRISSGNYPVIVMIVFAMFLVSCGGGQNRAQKEQLKEAKQTTIQNINRYKNEIQERINYVEGQIEEASGELEENLKEARTELKAQKDLLAQELKNVEEASIEQWNDIVGKASESLGKARSKMNEVSKNVRTWLEDEEE